MMTYGDLRIGQDVINPETSEEARITALGNGLVEITMTGGPGEPVGERTLSPNVLCQDWTVDRGQSPEGYGPHACDAPRVGE
jgi:hypothetical protein